MTAQEREAKIERIKTGFEQDERDEINKVWKEYFDSIPLHDRLFQLPDYVFDLL